MKKPIKTIIICILIGFVGFPTITLGGTFVFSLIQGKTAEEAVQILAEQLDILIGRVGVVEIKQAEQGETISDLQSTVDQQKELIENQKIQLIKENACRKADDLKIAPPETKIAYYTQGNKPIDASWAPDTTEELLSYLHGYWEAYENSDGIWSAYMHSPDYMPEFVQKYISILEERQREYFTQQELCNQ